MQNNTIFVVFKLNDRLDIFQIADGIAHGSIFICIKTSFRKGYFRGNTAFNAYHNKAHSFLRRAVICSAKDIFIQNIVIFRCLQYALQIIVNSKRANHGCDSIFDRVGIHNYVIFVYFLCLAEHTLDQNRWFNPAFERRCIQLTRIVF